MVQVVPLYLVYCDEDNIPHISVGVEPSTLCEINSIKSAVQVENLKKSEKLENENICKKCLNMWENINDNLRVESITECHRCYHTYSESACRTLTDCHSEKEVPICKPCYEEIYQSESSPVEIPYEEAEPWFNYSGNRKLDLEKVELD